MTLDDFIAGIGGFVALPHPERVKLFAWFLHAHGRRERFEAQHLQACYDDSHQARPINIHSTLKDLAARKPPVVLRDAGGYRLEARVRAELDARHGVPRHRVAVSGVITNLVGFIPGAAEKAFLQETVTCYEHGAFRSAIVMAWALAMDHVFEWLLSDATRLATFNARIPARYPKKKDVQINTRDDFEDLKESEVIELLRSSNLISKNVGKVLDEKLDRRNNAAHPSTLKIDQPQAEDVITDLVNNVLLTLK